MIISAFSFALMGAAVRTAETVPFMEKVFFRNLIITLVVVPVLIRKSRTSGAEVFTGKAENRPKLLIRSLFGFSGVVMFFYSLERLQLGDSAILNKLSAFFVIILSAVFLKEKIRKYQVPALAAAFTGAVLIIKPGFNMLLFPALIGFFSAVVSGCAYTTISAIRGKEDSLTIIFWFSMISLAASVVPLLMIWRTPTPAELLSLVLTGCFAAAGQYFLTLSYSFGNPGEVSIFNYTHVVFSAVIGFILLGEVPDAFSFAGAALVIGAAFFLYLMGRRAD